MKSIRKMVTAAVAVLAVVSMLLMTGCSTPAIAATINGVDYTTGEYLANLYFKFTQAYYDGGLYQYASYGMDPWEQTFPYGEGEEQVEMLLADYIVQQTKDGMVRQQAVKTLMEKYGIAVPQEELDEFNAEMAETPESEMLAYGFNKEHYCNMYIAVNLEEQAVFYGLYDEGGERAVSADDIRKFFDENYVAYKSIALAHTDAEGNALSDDDIKTNKDMLNNYLELMKTGKTMDEVIAQYNADMAEESAEVTEETTEEATEETAEDTTEEAAEELAEETEEESEASTGETAEENENIQMANAVSGDENIVKAVLSVKEGETAIVEYTDANGTTYTALINRVNVETAGGEGYYEDQHDAVLYGMKFDEFDEEVEGVVDTLEYSFNERAVEMCSPKNFEEDMAA